MTPEPPSAPDVDLFGRPPGRHGTWAHRRGEPRGLALGWTLYLMAATGWALAPVLSGAGMDPSVYRPAARVLVVLIVVGVCVLWPMLRATQATPERPVADVWRDLLVLLIPGLTLLWPQVLLAGWSPEVVGAASVVLVAWAMMIGAWLGVLYSAGTWGVWARLAAVGAPFAAVVVLPGALWMSGTLDTGTAGRGVTQGWMLTPVTGVWEVVRDRAWTGVPARVERSHWYWAIGLLAGGVCSQIVLLVAAGGRPTYRS